MTEKFTLDKEIIELAKSVATKIEDTKLRKRAYALNIAANAVAKQLKLSTAHSLYKIPSFTQNFELADLYIDGVRLDVRVSFNGQSFSIPKIQKKYEAEPHAYVVLQLEKDLESAKILGFVPTEKLGEGKSDEEYYLYSTNILSPIENLKDFASKIELKQKIFSANDHEKIKELAASFIDNEISESEKVYFIKHIVSCPVCRETFCDLNGFDLTALQVINYHELLNDSTLSVLSGNKTEIAEATIANMATVENAEENFEETITAKEAIVEDVESKDSSIEELEMLEDDSETIEFSDDIESLESFKETENTTSDLKTDEEIIHPMSIAETETEKQEESIEIDNDEITLPMSVSNAEIEEKQSPEVIETTEESEEELIEFHDDIELLEMEEETIELHEETTEIDNDEITLPMSVSNVEIEEKQSPEVIETTEESEEELIEFHDDVELLEMEEETIELHEETTEIDNDEITLPMSVSNVEIEEKQSPEVIETTEESEEELIEFHDDIELLEMEEETIELHEETNEIETVAIENNAQTENISNEITEDLNTVEEIITEDNIPELLESEELLEILEESDELVEKENTPETKIEEAIDITLETENEDLMPTSASEKAMENDNELVVKLEDVETLLETEEKEVSKQQEPIDIKNEQTTITNEVVNNIENHSYEEVSLDELASLSDISDEPEISENNEVDSTESEEIKQLLDDDLKAMLSEENTTVNNIQETTNIPVQQTKTNINTLYETPTQHAKTNVNNEEFVLPPEPVSETTVNSAKKALTVIALFILLASAGVAAWFVNNQKNAANDIAMENTNPDEMFNMQNQNMEEQTPAVSQDINKSMTNSFSEKPSAITITKLSWQISEKLALENSVKEYLQTAGKNIQMNLQNDLSNSADINFNNSIKVSFEIAQDNTLKGLQILESSGSDQIDDIVARSIKNTLKYVSVPKIESHKSDYFLTLIINF